MSTMKNLCNLLGINQKINDQRTRMLYLNEVWGLSQDLIADIEDCSQSFVSQQLFRAREMMSHKTFLKRTDIIWTVDEIRYIQFLPRDIIKDVEVIAFVNNILGLEIHHPFYMHYNTPVTVRIAALYNMGIQNKHLQKVFGRKQTAVSNAAKRYKSKVSIDRPNRYDSTVTFSMGLQKSNNNFLLAGGTDV